MLLIRGGNKSVFFLLCVDAFLFVVFVSAVVSAVVVACSLAPVSVSMVLFF